MLVFWKVTPRDRDILCCCEDQWFNMFGVQTFNSCTSRPGVRTSDSAQVYRHVKNMPSTPMNHVTCISKLRSVVRFIHSYMPRKLAGNRAFGRVFVRGLPMHLVQELNVSSVCLLHLHIKQMHNFGCICMHK